MAKAYGCIDVISFLCRSEEKMHNFQAENGGRNFGREVKCIFHTSLDFEKSKVLLNLSIYFSKITYHRVYF